MIQFDKELGPIYDTKSECPPWSYAELECLIECANRLRTQLGTQVISLESKFPDGMKLGDKYCSIIGNFSHTALAVAAIYNCNLTSNSNSNSNSTQVINSDMPRRSNNMTKESIECKNGKSSNYTNAIE